MNYRYSIITLWDNVGDYPNGTIIGALVQDDRQCCAKIRYDKDFLDEQSTVDRGNLSVTWGQRLYNLEEKTNDLLEVSVVLYINKVDEESNDIYEVADHIRPNDRRVLSAIRQKATRGSIDPMSPDAQFPFPTYSDWIELKSDKKFEVIANEILKQIVKQVRDKEGRDVEDHQEQSSN